MLSVQRLSTCHNSARRLAWLPNDNRSAVYGNWLKLQARAFQCRAEVHRDGAGLEMGGQDRGREGNRGTEMSERCASPGLTGHGSKRERERDRGVSHAARQQEGEREGERCQPCSHHQTRAQG